MRYFIVFILMFLAACGGKTSPENSAWNIVQTSSVISFWTTKNETISEQHNFIKFIGKAKDNKAVIGVDLASVETNIDIRNTRIRAHLFETDTYPKMIISADINLDKYQLLKAANPFPDTINVNVNLHGVEKVYSVQVSISQTDDGTVTISSAAPVLVHAQDFKLGAGVEKLRELAGLDSISTQVPVTFTLVFSR